MERGHKHVHASEEFDRRQRGRTFHAIATLAYGIDAVAASS
jgi:hypothetical protein